MVTEENADWSSLAGADQSANPTATESEGSEAVAIIVMPANRAQMPSRKQREEHLLGEVRGISVQRDVLRQQQFELVDWCRDEGITWGAIADAVGMSVEGLRQAHQRHHARRA